MDNRTQKSLVAAFARIADFLNEDGIVNRKTGELGNKLGFTQKAVLSGFIYALRNAVAYEEHGPKDRAIGQRFYSLDDALSALVAAKASYRVGDEVSAQRLANMASWVEDIEYRIQHLNALTQACMATYEKVVGTPWAEAKPKTTTNVPSQADTAAMAAAEKLLARHGKASAPVDTAVVTDMETIGKTRRRASK